MGAWGSGTFDNDDALDWLGELEASKKSSVIAATIKKVTQPTKPVLESSDCCAALAAAELVAAAAGTGSPYLPEEALQFLADHPLKVDAKLMADTHLALEKIASDSELKDVWDESDTPEDWYDCIAELKQRLKSADVAGA